MILSGNEVVKFLEVDLPRNLSHLGGIHKEQIQPNGVDCRIFFVRRVDPESTMIFRRHEKQIPELEMVEPVIHRSFRPGEDDTDTTAYFNLEPGAYNFETAERIKVPQGIMAWFVGRSTLNRNGILLMSSVYDTGFNGRIGGTAYVWRRIQIEMFVRVGQIVCWEAHETKEYDGQYGDRK
jgi:deoxycytidine triphosphate deaminase